MKDEGSEDDLWLGDITSTIDSGTRMSLQPIPELPVLSIGHVRKLDILHMFGRGLVPSLVLKYVVELQHKRKHAGSRASHNYRDFGWNVAWGTCRGKAKWADNVSDAKGHEEDGVHGHLAGVSRGLRNEATTGTGQRTFFVWPA